MLLGTHDPGVKHNRYENVTSLANDRNGRRDDDRVNIVARQEFTEVLMDGAAIVRSALTGIVAVNHSLYVLAFGTIRIANGQDLRFRISK